MAAGEFCKVCGGYRDDCPQHIRCPNQDPAVLKAAIAAKSDELTQLEMTLANLENQ